MKLIPSLSSFHHATPSSTEALVYSFHNQKGEGGCKTINKVNSQGQEHDISCCDEVLHNEVIHHKNLWSKICYNGQGRCTISQVEDSIKEVHGGAEMQPTWRQQLWNRDEEVFKEERWLMQWQWQLWWQLCWQMTSSAGQQETQDDDRRSGRILWWAR